MNLDIFNDLVNDVKKSNEIQNLIKEVKKYLENNIIKNDVKEEIPLVNPTYDSERIITKYRDEMLTKRLEILNNYAQNTQNKGEMYYIYSKNSESENSYNICICEEDKSHIVIEKSQEELPSGAIVGSVLRKNNDRFIIDEKATKTISEKLDNMKSQLLEEQREFLASQRIEGHMYEMAEKSEDRALLFDITAGNDEGFEEIDFPLELLNESKEGELFVFEDGEYIKVDD